jgi:hypothetical protein
MMSIGSKGQISVFDHFMGFQTATMGTTMLPAGSNGVNYVSVNEGSFAAVTDEPGGILQITTDTADNDNCFLCIGPFKPADGGVVMEARLKMADITTGALYVGFTETLDATTPVMPAEFATATITYNGSGGMVGLQFDSDGTTPDWRAVFGDGGAVSSGADANGTRAYNAPVNDKFDVIRVEIDVNGYARVLLGSDSGGFKVVKEVNAAVVTPADLQWAVVGIENRSAAASVLEVDYMLAKGNIDWTQ